MPKKREQGRFSTESREDSVKGGTTEKTGWGWGGLGGVLRVPGKAGLSIFGNLEVGEIHTDKISPG